MFQNQHPNITLLYQVSYKSSRHRQQLQLPILSEKGSIFCTRLLFRPRKNTDRWIYESLSKFPLFLKKLFITVTLIIVVTDQKDVFCINLLWLDLTFLNRFCYSWLHNFCFTFKCFSPLPEVTEIVKSRK